MLAGDSGRKIAEVIDLQGAIYHALAMGGVCVSFLRAAEPVCASPKRGKGKSESALEMKSKENRTDRVKRADGAKNETACS